MAGKVTLTVELEGGELHSFNKEYFGDNPRYHANSVAYVAERLSLQAQLAIAANHGDIRKDKK